MSKHSKKMAPKRHRTISNEVESHQHSAVVQDRSSNSGSGKTDWKGLLTWVSDCPKCPLLYFTADYAQMEHRGSNENVTEISWSSQADGALSERRKKLIQQAKNFIDKNDPDQALKVLLELTRCVSYRINEEEFTLLISTAETVVRNRLPAARQMIIQNVSDVIDFVKTKTPPVSSAPADDEKIDAEKENLSSLLLTLVDIIQSIRAQKHLESLSMGSESTTLDTAESPMEDEEVENNFGRSSEKCALSDRLNLYLTFFSLLIQSAFLEAGLVSGSVYVNRLIGNAEEAYYLTLHCKDKHLAFMKPLGAFIYGRLWCETSDDESLGADFLSEFYDEHGADFEAMLETDLKHLHSTYLCNMRRIRQTVHKYHHLL